jgi:hypothetical protein
MVAAPKTPDPPIPWSSQARKRPTSRIPREDAAALEVAVIENMAREDLNPVEQARACAMLAGDQTIEELDRDLVTSLAALHGAPAGVAELASAALPDCGQRRERLSARRCHEPCSPARHAPRPWFGGCHRPERVQNVDTRAGGIRITTWLAHHRRGAPPSEVSYCA